MIIVTGGAGFIGSNIVKQLNNKGRNDILIVDDLTDGRKIKNIEMLDFADYIDYCRRAKYFRLWPHRSSIPRRCLYRHYGL